MPRNRQKTETFERNCQEYHSQVNLKSQEQAIDSKEPLDHITQQWPPKHGLKQ